MVVGATVVSGGLMVVVVPELDTTPVVVVTVSWAVGVSFSTASSSDVPSIAAVGASVVSVGLSTTIEVEVGASPEPVSVGD